MKELLLIFGAVVLFSAGCSQLAEHSVVSAQNQCLACHMLPPSDKVHSAHVARGGFDCAVCHPGTLRQADTTLAPAEALHGNGVADVQVTATFDPTRTAAYSAQTKTCAGVYCHGNFKGGTHRAVGLADSISINSCTSCHDIARMQSVGHGPHFLATNPVFFQTPGNPVHCYLCHLGYDYSEPRINKAAHIDVKVEIDSSCHSLGCHN